jgi:hypothetical protein
MRRIHRIENFFRHVSTARLYLSTERFRQYVYAVVSRGVGGLIYQKPGFVYSNYIQGRENS